jgi:N-acetylglucosamine-6-sulfatase
MTRRRGGIAIALLVVATALVAGGALQGGQGSASHAATRPAAVSRPNVVFILADDLSWNLIDRRFAPHVVALQHRGETFSNYFVADSLCCPSRATIFTGLFPHDTHVLTNLGRYGGYTKFQSEGLDRRTYAIALRRRGYRTSMLGKYLNGYGDPALDNTTGPVPPGWSDWHAANKTGYPEFNAAVNDNGTINHLGGPTGGCGATGTPDNYFVDVMSSDATAFIDRAKGGPFAIEAATFAPHKPSTPAPRNACDFPGLTEPRDPSFDSNNSAAPAWLGQRAPLKPDQITALDAAYRKRAQSVEAIDQLLADVEAKLAADHLLDSTYIVFSSDNGYHLGQHRLLRGKQTAFDTDIRVPLIVAGPGVPQGRTVTQVAQNVDLYPTLVGLAGGKAGPKIEGRSLVPLLRPRGRRAPWRTVALVEHRHLNDNPADPDFEGDKGRNAPTTYEAIRVSGGRLPHFARPLNAVYVEYANAAHEVEYYDVAKDPFERHNIAGRLKAAQRAVLHRVLARLHGCHSASACWAAGLPR